MKLWSSSPFTILLSIAILILILNPVSVEGESTSFSVKFRCGESTSQSIEDKSQHHFTVIDIHNLSSIQVEFQWMSVSSDVMTNEFKNSTISGSGTTFINCKDIEEYSKELKNSDGFLLIKYDNVDDESKKYSNFLNIISSYSVFEDNKEIKTENEKIEPQNFKESSKTSIELKSPASTVTITKYIGPFSSSDPSIFKSSITNFGEHVPENSKVIYTDLIRTDESRFVEDKKFINTDKFSIKIMEITPNELVLDFVLDEKELSEGTYTGQILVTGDNFENIPLIIQLVIKESPWGLAFFNILGLGISVGIGLWLFRSERKKAYKKQIDDDSGIISHINGHIREINKLKVFIDQDFWTYLEKTFSEKKYAIDKYKKSLSLDETAEAVKWFHETVENIKKYHLRKSEKTFPKRTPFELVEKPNEKTENLKTLYKKIKGVDTQKNLKELVKEKIKLLKEFERIDYNEEDIDKLKKELYYILKPKNGINIDIDDTIQRLSNCIDADWNTPQIDEIFCQLKNGEQILPEIEEDLSKIKDEDKKYHDLKRDKIRDLFKKETEGRKKIIYAAITIFVSVPTSIFVSDSFVGASWANYVISIATGFGIYRIQNIRDLFKKQ